MKRRMTAASIMLILIIGITAANADDKSKFAPKAVGFSLVGTHQDAAQAQGSGIGLGGQISLDFNLSRNFTLTAGGGILTATDDVFSVNSTKTIFLPSIDLSVKYNFMQNKPFQPIFYTGYGVYNASDQIKTAGGGTVTVSRGFKSYFLVGTGFEVKLNTRQNKFFVSGEYRNTAFTDGPKPLYWVVKTGLSLSLDNPTYLAEVNEYQDELSELFVEEESSFSREMNFDSKIMSIEEIISYNSQRIDEMRGILHSHDTQFAALATEEITPELVYSPEEAVPAVPYLNRYRQALDIYQKADYQTAMQIFGDLAVSEPYHEFASNCRYWLGECYHALGENEKAIVEFDYVLSFSNSHKLDDSLLMKGQCYLLMDRKEVAFSIFRELLRRFPDSEYKARARNYLNAG